MPKKVEDLRRLFMKTVSDRTICQPYSWVVSPFESTRSAFRGSTQEVASHSGTPTAVASENLIQGDGSVKPFSSVRTFRIVTLVTN